MSTHKKCMFIYQKKDTQTGLFIKEVVLIITFYTAALLLCVVNEKQMTAIAFGKSDKNNYLRADEALPCVLYSPAQVGKDIQHCLVLTEVKMYIFTNFRAQTTLLL